MMFSMLCLSRATGQFKDIGIEKSTWGETGNYVINSEHPCTVESSSMLGSLVSFLMPYGSFHAAKQHGRDPWQRRKLHRTTQEGLPSNFVCFPHWRCRFSDVFNNVEDSNWIMCSIPTSGFLILYLIYIFFSAIRHVAISPLFVVAGKSGRWNEHILGWRWKQPFSLSY